MVLKNSFPITERLGLTINTSCCCAIRAKAPVWRVPTNPSLKAGVSDDLIVRLSSRRSLNWALALIVPVLSLSKCLIFKVSDNKLVQIIYCQSHSVVHKLAGHSLCRLPPWNDSTPFFPQKKPKKACILLHFCIIILFKEKTISYHLSI